MFNRFIIMNCSHCISILFGLVFLVTTVDVYYIKNSFTNHEIGDICKSYTDDATSLCVQFHDCPMMQQFLMSRIKTYAEIRLLQSVTCGFHLSQPLVCCPIEEIRIQIKDSEESENGGSDSAEPKPIVTTVTSEPIVFPAENNAVEGLVQPSIKPANTVEEHENTKSKVRVHPNFSLLPRIEKCGNSITADRIVGGDQSDRGAHPWMARIGFMNNVTDELNFDCAGTLINSHYILTASHCFSQSNVEQSISTIRIGEYNTHTDEDCENNSTLPCSMHTDFSVSMENVIMHPNYSSKDKYNDIALIRLNEGVDLTTPFIRPICLPMWKEYGLGQMYSAKNISQFVGKKGIVSGWGLQSWYETEESETLQEVKVPIVSNEECQTKFSSKKAEVRIIDEQMCAGGVVNKDACKGDSGGAVILPLSAKTSDGRRMGKIFQLGIVSFGQRLCSKGGLPTIFTRLTAYTDWILDNIKL